MRRNYLDSSRLGKLLLTPQHSHADSTNGEDKYRNDNRDDHHSWDFDGFRIIIPEIIVGGGIVGVTEDRAVETGREIKVSGGCAVEGRARRVRI